MTTRNTTVNLAVALALFSIVAPPTTARAQPPQANATKTATPAGARSTSAGEANLQEPLTSDYVIGPDDLLSIVFWRDQQLSGDVLVRPDGKISIPLLDEQRAAGLTPRQLREQLAVEARRFVAEPIVTVVVKQINSRKVYIAGQVVRPGQYVLASQMTVMQLIATAGGLTDYTKGKDIVVVRLQNGQVQRLKYDYDDATRARTSSAPDVELKPGDTVIVR